VRRATAWRNAPEASRSRPKIVEEPSSRRAAPLDTEFVNDALLIRYAMKFHYLAAVCVDEEVLSLWRNEIEFVVSKYIDLRIRTISFRRIRTDLNAGE